MMPISPQITITPETITTKNFNITAVTFTSSTATYTATGHTFSVGDVVLVTDIAPDGYNGSFTITATATNTFTVANTTNATVTFATGNAFWASATDYDLAAYSATYSTDPDDVNSLIDINPTVINAVSQASSAATAAATAQSDATTALANAATAYSTGVAAQSTANTALANAATADAKGVAAQSTANTALANAATADAKGVAAQSTANTALANAGTAYTAAIGSLQPSANTIVNASNQITAIASNGITVYSGSSATSGARVVMNSAGLAGYDASNNPTFSITASTGAAVFSGSVTGATITGGTLNIGGNAIINSSGYLTATGATITGTITSNNVTITGGTLTIGSTFAVTAGGVLSATGATITGTLTSNNVTITGGTLTIGSTFAVTSGGVLTATGATITGTLTSNNVTITGGTLNIGGNAIINSSGYLTATGATITGTITATSGSFTGTIYAAGGTIGGFTIGTNYLYSGNVSIYSTGDISSTGTLYYNYISINSGSLGSYKLAVQGDSGFYGTVNATGNMTAQAYLYNSGYPSTTGAANMRINTSSGLIAYTSSSARYKVAIEEQAIPAASIFSLTPKSYVDKTESEEKGTTEGLQRWIGLIAEDVAQIPVLKDYLVEYNAEGEPNSVYYDRVGVALIPALKELNNRLLALEGK
jgi:hypothetical protein